MKEDTFQIAIVGNPNVGKTSLFNRITGGNQHVGNWPGVTVERREGMRKWKGRKINFIDLPGTYSLTPYSLDERIARDFILEGSADLIIQVVDGSNLERNLFLTSQLLDCDLKVVLALNMYDIVKKRGDKVLVSELERELGVPVVPTVGSTGEGIETLIDRSIGSIEDVNIPPPLVRHGEDIERRIAKISNLFPDKKDPRWTSIKLLEGDEEVPREFRKKKDLDDMERIIGDLDPERFLLDVTDLRYETITGLLKRTIRKAPRRPSKTELVDSVLTNKYLGIPIFLVIMWGVFELTFTFSAPFMDLIDMGAGWASETVSDDLQPDWLGSLVGDGIIGGVGAVLIFVPNIFILFFMLSILESSGYMARSAFIMDKLMHKIGLSGQSFIPMIMGFGCNVPAIMATRTIKDPKDRLITILVNPFISCGARLPIYILFAGIFFGRGASNVVFLMYIIGIVVAIGSAKLFRVSILKGEPAPFIMELPPYRPPSLRSSLMYTWEKGYLYIRKAGSVILIGVAVIWFLANFTPSLTMTSTYGSDASIAGELGRFIQPVFEPLGFDWKIVVALLFGLVAKEIVVGGLGTLYGVGENEDALTDKIRTESGMTGLNAMGLMVFSLLYVPCIAAMAVIKKETGSWKWTIFSVVYSLVVAYLAALLIYQGGLLLGLG